MSGFIDMRGELWPDTNWLEKAYARRDLFALSPDLAVLCADAIDALEAWKTARDAWLNDPDDDPFGDTALTFKAAEEELPSLLARLAALQPDNAKEGT